MARWTDRRVVIDALERAIEYEFTYLDAVAGDDAMCAKTEEMIARYRRVLERLSGRKTTMKEIYDQEVIANCPTVSAFDLLEEMRTTK